MTVVMPPGLALNTLIVIVIVLLPSGVFNKINV